MSPSTRSAAVFLAVLVCRTPFDTAAAQESQEQSGSTGVPVTLEALELTQGINITLDGRIDEETWSRATPITDFTQQEPVEGGVPSEETEIRVVFDEDDLLSGPSSTTTLTESWRTNDNGMPRGGRTIASCGSSIRSSTERKWTRASRSARTRPSRADRGSLACDTRA